jgi:hypothetical protein
MSRLVLVLPLLAGCSTVCSCFGTMLPPPPEDAIAPDLDTVVDAFVVADEDRPGATYHLSRLPVRGTIQVVVSPAGSGSSYDLYEAAGYPPVGDWIYDDTANAVRLITVLPEPGAVVTLTYERLDAIARIATQRDARGA